MVIMYHATLSYRGDSASAFKKYRLRITLRIHFISWVFISVFGTHLLKWYLFTQDNTINSGNGRTYSLPVMVMLLGDMLSAHTSVSLACNTETYACTLIIILFCDKIHITQIIKWLSLSYAHLALGSVGKGSS